MKKSQKYHKIMSLFKRNIEGDNKFIIGEWSTPELAYLKDKDWQFSEKYDGTNLRIMYDGKDIKYGGRSDNAQIPVELIYKLDELFKSDGKWQVFEELFGTQKTSEDSLSEMSVTLYGEGYGAKIQKGGGNYMSDGKGVDFILFDIQINGIYLERKNVEDIATKLGIKCVPIIGHGTLEEAIELVKKGFKSTCGDFIAEGIVARPKVELRTRRGDRIITKVKHIDFK